MGIKYPGRQTHTVDSYLQLRPDIKEMRVYDLQLSTGDLLYRCGAGGVGVTKEKHIPHLHAFIQKKNSISIIQEMWREEFKEGECEKAYYAARSVFNSKRPRLTTWNDCARLYCLLTASGHTHIYQNKAFFASHFPYKLDLAHLSKHSEMSRTRELEFDTTDMFSFREQELDTSTLIYLHLPYRYGKYGLGYVWSKRKLLTIQRVFTELHELGYRICVSALYEKRGYIVHPENLFPSFHRDIITHCNDQKYGLTRVTSEIYYTNFQP